MKKNIIFTLLIAGLFSVTSCALFEIDNYDAPEETLRGSVVDVATGAAVLTDQGSEGIRVRLTELSYGDNVQHNPDFFCKPDGTFQNTKLFAGEYNIRIDGPFIPLVRETSDGAPIADETITTTIKGVTEVKFEVQPFLNVEIVGLPQVSDGKITAKVKVTRGVSKEEFKEKIEPMGGYSDEFTNVTDIQLFVSHSSYVGYRARDTRYSSEIKYSGASFEDKLGQEIDIASVGTIPSGHQVYVRAAARINYSTAEQRRWNYSEPIVVMIP